MDRVRGSGFVRGVASDWGVLGTGPLVPFFGLVNGGQVGGRPRSFFGVGGGPGVAAPPTGIVLSFSAAVTSADINNAVQLIRSADTPASAPDGDFGTLGTGGLGSSGGGFSRVPATVVVSGNLVSVIPTAPLVPDHYRIYLPN